MKDKELEMYKGFFDRVENIIKDDKEVSYEEKLIVILLELENMIRYKNGGVSKEVDEFIQKYRNHLHDNIKNNKAKEIINEILEYFRNNTITYPYSMLEVLCKAEQFLKGDGKNG